MKLKCPRCGESIPYDADRAGMAVTCTHCGTAYRMPSPDQLPEELREEYEKEVAKRQKADEGMRREIETWEETIENASKLADETRAKKEEAEAEQKRRAAAFAAETRRQWEAEASRRKPLAERRKKFDDVAAREVPEEFLLDQEDRYAGASNLSGLFLFLGGVNALGAIIGLFAFPWDKAPDSWPLLAGVLVGCAFSAVLCWGVAALLNLFIDVANDLRISRLLLKRLAYPPQTPGERTGDLK